MRMLLALKVPQVNNQHFHLKGSESNCVVLWWRTSGVIQATALWYSMHKVTSAIPGSSSFKGSQLEGDVKSHVGGQSVWLCEGRFVGSQKLVWEARGWGGLAIFWGGPHSDPSYPCVKGAEEGEGAAGTLAAAG